MREGASGERATPCASQRYHGAVAQAGADDISQRIGEFWRSPRRKSLQQLERDSKRGQAEDCAQCATLEADGAEKAEQGVRDDMLDLVIDGYRRKRRARHQGEDANRGDRSKEGEAKQPACGRRCQWTMVLRRKGRAQARRLVRINVISIIGGWRTSARKASKDNSPRTMQQSRLWSVVALVTGKTRISHKGRLRLMLRLLAQAGFKS